MGSKNSKQAKKGEDAKNKGGDQEQPMKQVQQYHKEEQAAHQKKMKAMNELPIVYVDENDTKVVIPPGGAKVVFRGQDGTQVKMEPAPEPTPQTRVIATSSCYGNGVVYSTPKTVVRNNADGTTTTSTIVVRPNYRYGYYDPYYYYDPFYYPYYGYRRYPYCYYW